MRVVPWFSNSRGATSCTILWISVFGNPWLAAISLYPPSQGEGMGRWGPVSAGGSLRAARTLACSRSGPGFLSKSPDVGLWPRVSPPFGFSPSPSSVFLLSWMPGSETAAWAPPSQQWEAAITCRPVLLRSQQMPRQPDSSSTARFCLFFLLVSGIKASVSVVSSGLLSFYDTGKPKQAF